jgi:hypothetical protein
LVSFFSRGVGEGADCVVDGGAFEH